MLCNVQVFDTANCASHSPTVARPITKVRISSPLTRGSLSAPASMSLVSNQQALSAIEGYLKGSNATVEPLYRIEKAGGFAHATPESVAFAEGRLAYGASELRDLIVWAWQDSLNETIGGR